MVGARTYAPSGLPASTLGAAAFHDPVRDGSGWVHRASRTPLAQGAAPSHQPLVSRPARVSPGKPSPMRMRRLHRRFVHAGPLVLSAAPLNPLDAHSG